MLKKYLPQLIMIAAVSLVSILIVTIVMFLYELFIGHGDVLVGVSNILFLEGAAIFLAGAFIELFMRSSSKMVYASFLGAYELLSRWDVIQQAMNERREKDDLEGSGGWTLVFMGIVIIAISLVFATLSMMV